MKNVTSTARICDSCGQPFTPASNTARRCTDCCTFTCRQCGTAFVSRRRRAIAFCSVACTNEWQQSSKAKDAARQRTIAVRGSGEVRRCVTCGEAFYVPGWRLKRTVKYCSQTCRDYPADLQGVNRVLRFPARVEANKLERAGRAILDGLRLEYQEQQVIGGHFVVDVLLATPRIVIQWDGDFWHANPAIYPDAPWPIQQANSKRDRSCNAYLARCGYRVLRFWESDVHGRPSWVADEVLRAFASSAST